ncbi:MAG: hypothetical protein HUJ31_10865 [Pseudomonadales bacterium]|nr:hypothetical protein [Pseudomonadales bacterium]
MFSFITKFAAHFGFHPFTAFDPMLIHLIRDEREREIQAAMRRKEAVEREQRAAEITRAQADEKGKEEAGHEVREAA